MPSSTPLNIFTMAHDNGPALETGYKALLSRSGVDATSLKQFNACVQGQGRVSVNVRSVAFHDFLENPPYKNIHRHAIIQAPQAGKTPKAWVQEKLGDWYLRRSRFECRFEDGSAFCYGLLNMGGVGVDHYGEYCAVVKRDYWEGASVAYLTSDSLRHFMGVGARLLKTKLAKNLADPGHRHYLTTLKHQNDIAAGHRDDCP